MKYLGDGAYSIKGEHPNGRGRCGCMIKKNEDYFIVRKKSELHATCIKCAGVVKHPICVFVLPDQLIGGAIPIK